MARSTGVRNLTHQTRQCSRQVVARRQVGKIICRQSHDGVCAEAFLKIIQDGLVDLIQALVLQYQPASTIEQAGRIAQST